MMSPVSNGREDVLARVVVDEVDLAVVGAEHHPRAPVALEHRGLAGPAAAAPRAGLVALGRLGAHAARLAGVAPQHLGRRGDRALAVVAAGRAAPEREQPGRGEAGRRPGRRAGRWWAARSCRRRSRAARRRASRASSASPVVEDELLHADRPGDQHEGAEQQRTEAAPVVPRGQVGGRRWSGCGRVARWGRRGGRAGGERARARPLAGPAGRHSGGRRRLRRTRSGGQGHRRTWSGGRVGPAVGAGRVIPVRVSPSRPLVAPQRSISTPSRRSGQLKL